MHENDRRATGFLEADEFETVAEQFFASPETSVRGWERACDAQKRIVREAEGILAEHVSGDILLVGHGAVGTLLYCHLAGVAISRRFDQPAGGGNYFSVRLDPLVILHGWHPMENL